MTRVRSGAWNALWRNNPGQQMRDVRRLMRGADVLAASEVQRDLLRRIRGAGYGAYLEKPGYDDAVIWDKRKYKALKFDTTRLNRNSTTPGGRANVRHAAAVLLRDRKTGKEFWQVSVHLAPRKGASKATQRRVQAEQFLALNRLVHRLSKNGTPVLVGGDFNRAGASVRGMRRDARTDVMYTFSRGAKELQSRVIQGGRGGDRRVLASDHGAILSRYRLGRSPKGGGKGGDNNGGGGNGEGISVVTDGSAYALLEHLFKSWGLPIGNDIARVIRKAMKDGITPDKIELIMPELQETKSWKTRFAGNEILKNSGLPVLSVAEYLSVEKSYAQVLKNFGLPKGFYDDPQDFAQFIGKSVSANELQQRATMFSDVAKREDPAVIAQLKSMGLTEGDILAHFMDAKRAMPILQKQYQQTLIGAAARRTGLTADNDRLARYADLGVTEEQAAQGFGLISEGLGTMERLGDIYKDNFDQKDFEAEVFEQDGGAARKRKRLASRERASFSGSSGVGQGSLSRNSGGSY